jgi:PAS domain S-box-containing protein
MFPSRPDLLDGVPARDARPADRHGPDAGVREPGPSRPDGNDPLDPVRMTADALARSPAFLLSVIDSFPDPIFVKDEQHRWLLLNDACVAMMGRPREELIGLSDHDLHPREQADASWERDELVLETGEPFVAREQIDWGGESRTVLTTKHRHRDAIHGRRYVVGSIKDLSPHLAMERALAESAASLGLTLEHSPLGIGTICWAKATSTSSTPSTCRRACAGSTSSSAASRMSPTSRPASGAATGRPGSASPAAARSTTRTASRVSWSSSWRT